jgi:hypothetical protein
VKICVLVVFGGVYFVLVLHLGRDWIQWRTMQMFHLGLLGIMVFGLSFLGGLLLRAEVLSAVGGHQENPVVNEMNAEPLETEMVSVR